MRIVTPMIARLQAIVSRTTSVVPLSASTITAVYVPEMPTRIIEWSRRRRKRRAAAAKRAAWYTPLVASIAVTQIP